MEHQARFALVFAILSATCSCGSDGGQTAEEDARQDGPSGQVAQDVLFVTDSPLVDSQGGEGKPDGAIPGNDSSLSDSALKDGAPNDGSSQEGLSDFAKQMLLEHNKVRASASPTPTPSLVPVAWSASAAQTAQNWANQCKFSHNSQRGNLGENIYASSGAFPGEITMATNTVKSWSSEAKNYNYTTNICVGTCGHYTQIVWRSTTAIGCAYKNCTTNSPFGSGAWNFVVCDYAPPGNMNGQRPY